MMDFKDSALARIDGLNIRINNQTHINISATIQFDPPGTIIITLIDSDKTIIASRLITE